MYLYIIDINLLIEEETKNIDMLCHKNNIKLTTNTIDDDIYIDYLESSDGINYKVVKQVHNELEDINNLHSRGK